MKITIVTLLVIVGILIADYYPVRFLDGYAYTAGPTALYVAPELPEDIILTIPPGELLEIKGFTGITIIYDSYQWGWYEAAWNTDSMNHSGYVFEPDLALSHLFLSEDTLLVYRTIGFREEAVTGIVSVIVSGDVLTSLEVQPIWLQGLYSFDVHSCLLDPYGIEGVRNLISLYSGDCIEIGSDREYLIAWTDDGQLVEGPHALGVAPGGPTLYWTEVILPSDDGGEDNRVKFNILGAVYDPDTNDWERIIDELVIYQWTGQEFEEI